MTTPKYGGEPWKIEDFRPVPSTKGAYYHPVAYGKIIYTEERDWMLAGCPDRRGPFKRLLKMLRLRAR